MSERENAGNFYDCFNESSPRPPVPGQERAYCASEWGRQMEWPQKVAYPYKESHEEQAENPSGYPCVQWASSLGRLLEDDDGIELFRSYLQSEGAEHAAVFDFWFACEGLRKQTEPERVRAIYRYYFQKSNLPITEELRKEVCKYVRPTVNMEALLPVLDKAQAEVECLISKTTYPNFLKSEMYLNYVESITNGPSCSNEFENDSSSSSSTVSNKEVCNLATALGPLPTLHEDEEFMPHSSVMHNQTPLTTCLSTGYHTPNIGPLRLTKDTLLVTQNSRAYDIQPKPEAYAGLFFNRGLGVHAAYNSYNPVSRQDSELQSLSSHSDARTESDNMSVLEFSADGRSVSSGVRRRKMQEQAAFNRETNMHQTLIPRTQRLDTRQYQPVDPKQYAASFAPLLIEKLEGVKREQQMQELFNRKLMQSDELSRAIREKLMEDDDNDQDILDEHVSRVFSDLTHECSPDITSPRSHSPTKARWLQKRKEKDGFSTFSGDSGNVRDFPEGSDLKLNMVKSKSVPEYAEERLRLAGSRKSSSKKTLTDLTDSGVSVVSDTPPVSHGSIPKDPRTCAWIMESDRVARGAGHTHSELSGKHCRHRKAYSGSRSSSVERNSGTGSLGPSQPFVADPGMPPLPRPNTSIQLEEARRRLEDADFMRTRTKQRSSSKYFPEVTQSSQSTLRKSTRTKVAVRDDTTTVVYSFCDEEFPYRTKIPGKHITLKQFKDFLPKKGNYRYFFKTECEELNNQVIQEEVSNDLDVIPTFEGKIMAQVKPVD